MNSEAKTYRFGRPAAAIIAVAVALVSAFALVDTAGNGDVGRSNSMTQIVSGLYSEDDVLDLCYRVAILPGVTGTSVIRYDAPAATATIMIYYEPSVVTSTQLRVFMKNSRIFFTSERKA